MKARGEASAPAIDCTDPGAPDSITALFAPDTGISQVPHLNVHPVLVGEGTPLFSALDATTHLATTHLQLAETRRFGNGVIHLQYERAHAQSPG